VPKTRRLSDASLVRRSQQGDRRSFGALVGRYDWRLRGLAHALLLDQGEMDAALAAAYLRAWRDVVRISTKDDIPAWLYRNAYNACVDRLRLGRPGARAARPTDAVVAGLAVLPELDRVAIVLVDREGFTPTAAARIMGIAPAQVEARVKAARAHLAAHLPEPAPAPVTPEPGVAPDEPAPTAVEAAESAVPEPAVATEPAPPSEPAPAAEPAVAAEPAPPSEPAPSSEPAESSGANGDGEPATRAAGRSRGAHVRNGSGSKSRSRKRRTPATGNGAHAAEPHGDPAAGNGEHEPSEPGAASSVVGVADADEPEAASSVVGVADADEPGASSVVGESDADEPGDGGNGTGESTAGGPGATSAAAGEPDAGEPADGGNGAGESDAEQRSEGGDETEGDPDDGNGDGSGTPGNGNRGRGRRARKRAAHAARTTSGDDGDGS
jgi:DNA-directed RNA polymerase specialized sigma24 family protein